MMRAVAQPVAPVRWHSLAGFVGFQAAWWATALLARAQRPALATVAMLAFVSAHVAMRRGGRRGASGLLVCAAALLGLGMEGGLRSTGLLSYDVALDAAPAPAFMIALWAGFACTLETSLRSITRRPMVAAMVVPRHRSMRTSAHAGSTPSGEGWTHG